MRILITNDDGILAPGIEALYQAVADLGDVEVVAPESAQSATGHGITVRAPMLVHRVHVRGAFWGWSVDGRPADCIKLALLKLLDPRPDFVLSGINAGVNTGINVLYSGTVAGAAEAALFGVPAMAFSLELSDELDFRGAGRIARSLFETFARSAPEPGVCLNVNIPALDAGPPVGLRVCPQSPVLMNDAYEAREDGQGRKLYWLDGRMPERGRCPGSDLGAIQERYVAVTPLRFDLTDAPRMQQVAAISWPQTFGA